MEFHWLSLNWDGEKAQTGILNTEQTNTKLSLQLDITKGGWENMFLCNSNELSQD